MKKFSSVLISFLIFSFYCFAGTMPYDYSYTIDKDYDYFNIDQVFVLSKNGMDVKEKPDENSRTLVHLPPATQVRVVAISGPKSNNKSEFYDDYYLDWAAIFLPDNLRYNGNQIGWINNPDDLWWDPYSDFIDRETIWQTKDWTKKDLTGFLLNHVWEMTSYIDGRSTQKKAIVVFEKDQGKGLLFSSDSEAPEETFIAKYKVLSGNQIEIKEDTSFFHKGIKTISSVSETFFEIYDNRYESCSFRAINPGTILEESFYENYSKKYHQQIENYIIKESRKFFRIYSKDWYCNNDISDYLLSSYYNDYEYNYETGDTMQNPYNLKTLAIAYGVWLDSTVKVFVDYWARYIKKYEQEVLPKGIYTYRGICKPYKHLYKEVTYKADSNLNLRESENRKSQVITIMNENTKVTIVDFGQPEVIDGILSTWVKVKIVENTIDRNNNILSEGTEGWCFGGYLIEDK